MDNVVSRFDLRCIVRWAAFLKISYFGIEVAVAMSIASVSLLADSVDFLQDAAVALLVALGLGWGLRQRARLGMVLAGLLLVPGIAALWTIWDKFLDPAPPAPMALTLAGAGALAINTLCAFMLARFRAHGGSLSRAAFLSVRNDVFANIAIIVAGLVTAVLWRSAWPDVVVGLGIAAMNAGAAREVWAAAHAERREAAA